MPMRPNLASFGPLSLPSSLGLADIRLPSPQRYDHRGGEPIARSPGSCGLGSLSSFPDSQSLNPTFVLKPRHPQLNVDCLRDDRRCVVEQGFNGFHRLQAIPSQATWEPVAFRTCLFEP